MISKKKTTRDLLPRFLGLAQGVKMEDLASTQELRKAVTINQVLGNSVLQLSKGRETKAV